MVAIFLISISASYLSGYDNGYTKGKHVGQESQLIPPNAFIILAPGLGDSFSINTGNYLTFTVHLTAPELFFIATLNQSLNTIEIIVDIAGINSSTGWIPDIHAIGSINLTLFAAKPAMTTVLIIANSDSNGPAEIQFGYGMFVSIQSGR